MTWGIIIVCVVLTFWGESPWGEERDSLKHCLG